MNLDPKAFWQALDAAEKARGDREHLTREVKVRPQYKTAANDEPEPVIVDASVRSLAESFGGKPFVLKGERE